MADVSFTAEPKAEDGANTAATPQEAAQPQTQAVEKRTPQQMGDYMPTADQIILPRINIVQGVGKLKDSFPQGAIVLNQRTVIFKLPVMNEAGEVKEPGSKPLNITCCGFKPVRYVEQIQGGARGMVVDTEAEVAQANGTLDYRTWVANKANGMKRFSPYVEGLFLIQKPDALESESFPYEIDGKQHAIVLWAMKGTAFTAAAKKCFFTERLVGCLQKGGYPSVGFALSTYFEKWGENGAFVPRLIPGKKSSEARVKFASDFLSAGATVTTESTEEE